MQRGARDDLRHRYNYVLAVKNPILHAILECLSLTPNSGS